MHILLRGGTAQRLRLASGLILFTFALTHFLNHSLGLISIDAMHAFQEARHTVTRSLIGGIILGSALFIHVSLALFKLARRCTLKIPAWELIQIGLGLAIPFLLIPHIVNTRIAHTLFGVNDIYFYELVRLWPAKGWDQSVLLLIVWAHGCVGMHFWLRLTSWYNKFFPVLLSLAVLLPVTSLAGFMVAGRIANDAIADPDVLNAIKQVYNWPSQDAGQAIASYGIWAKGAFYVLLGAIGLVILGRWSIKARHPKITVTYDPEPTVTGASGSTLLEFSRMNNIPHLSVCGGRARCSTCRVQVLTGNDTLPPPVGAEAATLAGISAKPGVRLACQLRPTKPITVNLLLQPDRGVKKSDDEQGVERILAVLFLDVRGFTSMSEDKLPYDVVFILNQLFAAVGTAIHEESGWIDKYLGDGLMAVFGRETSPEDGCRRAIRAARKIDMALDQVNHDLSSELPAPLKIGIGLHVGPLVLGSIGHDNTAAMTVIGRTVNAAARLEAATKDLSCQFVMSQEAARMAGLDLSSFTTQAVKVRGLTEPLQVIPVILARDLPNPARRVTEKGA